MAVNGPNIEALAALLEKLVAEGGWMSPGMNLKARAEWLAAHGALVPSALTDEQISRTIDACAGDHWDEVPDFGKARAELERIAKGEQLGPDLAGGNAHT